MPFTQICHRFSPAVLALLAFLIAQGVGGGTLLLFGFGVERISLFSLVMMAANILAVLCCRYFLHIIRFSSVYDFASVKWGPGMYALAGGMLGAVSISILADKVELPDEIVQISLAMMDDFWGLITLVIVGPITEEFLFREAIAGEMLRRGAEPWMAIVVSAVAFGIMHLNLAQGLYALPMGLLFGIIYYKTGNIILTSLLHIFNNYIAAAQLRTMGADVSCAELFGSNLRAYTVMVLFGVLCVVFMKMFWNSYVTCDPNTGLQRNSNR